MIRWSIITVTYNSSDTISHYWQDYGDREDIEWIVVDNNSCDDTVEVAKGLGARVIALKENVGFAKANNIGFRESTGLYIAFVNPDVRVIKEDLREFEAEILKNPRRILAPQLRNSDGSYQPNGRGKPLLWYKMLNRIPGTANFLNDRYLLIPKNQAEELTEKEVYWLTGAVVVLEREAFIEIGRWDERYFLYHEDAELSLNARKKGFVPTVLSGINWEHGWKRETSGGFRLKPWLRELNSARKFYTRHPRYILF